MPFVPHPSERPDIPYYHHQPPPFERTRRRDPRSERPDFWYQNAPLMRNADIVQDDELTDWNFSYAAWADPVVGRSDTGRCPFGLGERSTRHRDRVDVGLEDERASICFVVCVDLIISMLCWAVLSYKSNSSTVSNKSIKQAIHRPTNQESSMTIKHNQTSTIIKNHQSCRSSAINHQSSITVCGDQW